MMDVGKRILELMEARNWTRYKLAKECGVYTTTVKAWLKNEYSPNLESIESICNAFNISIVEFFSGVEENNLTTKQLVLLERYDKLSENERVMLFEIMDILLKNRI